jgi:SIR2-like domain
MSDRGLTWGNCGGVLAQRSKTNGWALCIGAGTSLGPFPTWKNLVGRVIAEDSTVPDSKVLRDQLNQSFSYDALIQASKDALGKDDDDFAQLLQDLLYEELRKAARTRWAVVNKALTTASPGQMHRTEWRAFRAFIDKQYPNLSAMQIAKVIVSVAKTPKEPAAILSFNAEPLLYALIHSLQAKKCRDDTELKKARLLDRVTRGISHREAGRIPFIFCHGLFPLEGGLKLFVKLASPEKLVFSEGEYLQLANSSFSWQSSLFIGTAVLRSMVFVGLSFSDQNLRRWLAWIHANKRAERELREKEGEIYGHYWLERDPGDDVKKRWIESSVRHLGVRLVWIDSWNRLGEYLQRMLSL